MVVILDGNSEIGSNVIRNLHYLICLRQLIRSQAESQNNSFFHHKRQVFLHSSATCSELPSNLSTMSSSEFRLDKKVRVCLAHSIRRPRREIKHIQDIIMKVRRFASGSQGRDYRV